MANTEELVGRALTNAEAQTLREMESYDPYYSWRPKTAQALVNLGLAVVVPERRPHMAVGRRITDKGRSALRSLRIKGDHNDEA